MEKNDIKSKGVNSQKYFNLRQPIILGLIPSLIKVGINISNQIILQFK